MNLQRAAAGKSVAILHQGQGVPAVGGVRKPPKPGGYADSGADIAWALQGSGVPVVSPAAHPDPARDLDWSFPDTQEGIARAVEGGAAVLWANTVLLAGHPVEAALLAGIALVGQEPTLVQRFDDKRLTNERLRAAGCPVAPALVVGDYEGTDLPDWRAVTRAFLAERGLTFPLVVKPIRGRGSAGVRRVDRWEDLLPALGRLLGAATPVDGGSVPTYGTAAMIEEYLPGDEVTVSVLPPGEYVVRGEARSAGQYWSLPPVLRFHHRDGIVPYSGAVAVTQNSRALEPAETDAGLLALGADCERAAAEVGARMVIRVDCRQDRAGRWRLFDLNMKPNMTGAGRPGRDDQDSLTALAARRIGWDYPALVVNLLGLAWGRRVRDR